MPAGPLSRRSNGTTNRRGIVHSWLILSWLGAVLIQLFHYSLLPGRVVANFGEAGVPNSWMSKEWNLAFGIAACSLVSLAFGLAPRMLSRFPVNYRGLPASSRSLSEDQKKQLLVSVSNWFHLLGLITNIFVVMALQIVFEANRTDPVRLDQFRFFTAAGLYGLILATWIVLFHRRFSGLPRIPNGRERTR